MFLQGLHADSFRVLPRGDSHHGFEGSLKMKRAHPKAPAQGAQLQRLALIQVPADVTADAQEPFAQAGCFGLQGLAAQTGTQSIGGGLGLGGIEAHVLP